MTKLLDKLGFALNVDAAPEMLIRIVVQVDVTWGLCVEAMIDIVVNHSALSISESARPGTSITQGQEEKVCFHLNWRSNSRTSLHEIVARR